MLHRILFAFSFAVAGCAAFAQSALPVISSSADAWLVQAGYPFNAAIAASNSPTAFAARGLPRGLTCNATTGALSGVTSVAGEFTVTLQATNAAGTGTATRTLVVNGPGPIEMPLVTGVVLPLAGEYRAGDTLTFGVSVDAPYAGVRVTGQPRIALAVGGATRYAVFTSVSDDGPRPTVNFSYTVQAGDAARQGIAIATAIEQNGGTIRDSQGLYCALGLPEVNAGAIIVADGGGAATPGGGGGLAAAPLVGTTASADVLAGLMLMTGGGVVFDVLADLYPEN